MLQSDKKFEETLLLLTERLEKMAIKNCLMEQTLKKIANIDYRGNRSQESVWAYKCLEEINQKESQCRN